MLPGKRYSPEDLILLLRRRFWLVVVPFAAVAAATAVYARRLPDVYRAEAVLQVVAQRVPESYVRPTVTTSTQERLQAIRQLLLSRSRLERMIEELNLYQDERRTMIMEDIVEQMRGQIGVQMSQGDVFRVSFIGRDPRTVMRVADRLASLFIDESLKDRAVLAEGTDQFLESQLQEARGRLIDYEKRLEMYRRQFGPQLPTQLQANLQAQANVQSQIRTTVDAVSRDQERRIGLERQLSDLENAPPGLDDASGSSLLNVGDSTGAGPAAQRLAAARRTLAGYEARHLTAAHPDVRQIQRVIRDLEAEVEAEALRAPVSGGAGVSPAEAARQKRIEELRANIAQLDKQIAKNLADEQRLRGVSAEYQHRIDAAPTRESELVELTRDYGTLQGTYRNILAKKEEANISANLERLQIGEQFKILDQARLPTRPSSPNRERIRMMGMGVGLAIGLCLLGLLEYRDSSFKHDDEVTRVLGLPVLAVVPVMVSPEERRRAKLRRIVLHAGLGSTVMGCLAVLAYTILR